MDHALFFDRTGSSRGAKAERRPVGNIWSLSSVDARRIDHYSRMP
jgi:hypothetical protein